jgi:hypothetical protein
MKKLPQTENALVLRTDFSSDAIWDSICKEIVNPDGEFQAYVDFVSDQEFSGINLEEILALSNESSQRIFLFVVDQTTFSHPEHPILVIDLISEPGRSFRVISSKAQDVENNLSIGNMDFAEFADHTDPDGVYRGFSKS